MIDWSFLLPNINFTALVPTIIAIVIGVLLIALGNELGFVPVIGKTARTAGLILVLGAFVYWFGVSYAQDILANDALTTMIIALIVIVVFGLLLFVPIGEKKGRRK